MTRTLTVKFNLQYKCHCIFMYFRNRNIVIQRQYQWPIGFYALPTVLNLKGRILQNILTLQSHKKYYP
jgi:hypothetical protein